VEMVRLKSLLVKAAGKAWTADCCQLGGLVHRFKVTACA